MVADAGLGWPNSLCRAGPANSACALMLKAIRKANALFFEWTRAYNPIKLRPIRHGAQRPASSRWKAARTIVLFARQPVRAVRIFVPRANI